MAALLAASPALWVAYSCLAIDHRLVLPRSIDAAQRRVASPRAGRLVYYADPSGDGAPVVLVHGLHYSSSSYEMRPLFERMRGDRPVYALDLPGFGCSERGDRPYTPALYAAAIVDVLSEIASHAGPDAEDGCHVVALGRSAELAARAALERGDLVRSLALLAPTGFGASAERDAPSGVPSDALRTAERRAVALHPIVARAAYDFLSTRSNLQRARRRMFVGAVDRALVQYDYLTAHQPHAWHAPLAVLGGALATPGVRERVYASLAVPALVVHDGHRPDRYDRLPGFVATHPLWSAARIARTSGLPQYERPDETLAELEAFWDEAGAALRSGGAAPGAGREVPRTLGFDHGIHIAT